MATGWEEEQNTTGVRLYNSRSVSIEEDPWDNIITLKAKEIYSEYEEEIGTWIDGKPIYRKVIETTLNLSNVTSVTTVTIPHNIDNMELCTNWRCFDANGNRFPFLANSGGITAITGVNATNITLRYINDSWASRTWWFILEYTKTTDD